MANDKEIDLKNLLEEYIKIKLNRAKVKGAEFVKTKKDSAEKSVSDLLKYMENTAKEYGQSINETSQAYKLKDEYEASLAEIKSTYEEMHQEILKERLKLELKELKITGKLAANKFATVISKRNELDNIEENAKEGNEEDNKEDNKEDNSNIRMDLLKERREILKARRECDKKLEECRKEMQDKMKFSEVFRDDKFHNVNKGYLITIKKKNPFTRALAWIKNKIDGPKRYAEEILQPLKGGIDNFKDKKLPEMKKRVQSEKENFILYLDSKIDLKGIEDESNIDAETDMKEFNEEEVKDVGIIDKIGELASNKYKGVKENISEKYNSAKESLNENIVNPAHKYLVEKPQETYNTILVRFNDKKEQVIDSMIKTLKENGKEVPTKEQEKKETQKNDEYIIE